VSRWLLALLVILVAAALAVWGFRQTSPDIANLTSGAVPTAPTVVMVDADRLQQALAAGPWVSAGQGEPVLWVVGHRSCAECVSYLRAEADALADAGVEVRVLLFAPDDAGPEERAVLAEIGARRSWSTLSDFVSTEEAAFYADRTFPPAADPVRAAIVAAGRLARDEIVAVLQANGFEARYPVLVWRGDAAGEPRLMMGDSDAGRRAVRDALADG
jgi:hypothetical protein